MGYMAEKSEESIVSYVVLTSKEREDLIDVFF